MAKRSQIVCIGSSSLYGVGGAHGSWADLFKQELHQRQYSENGIGQVHEIYNLGIPGAKIENFLDRIETELQSMKKPGRNFVSVIQLGGNNTMAVDTPDGFVTTADEFRLLVEQIIDKVKPFSNHVIWVGMNLMDESKVMPIENDLEKNRKVYFPNSRKIEFDSIAKQVCKHKGVTHISIIDEQTKNNWVEQYQYTDGIHPNDRGYQWMLEQIRPYITNCIEADDE